MTKKEFKKISYQIELISNSLNRIYKTEKIEGLCIYCRALKAISKKLRG